MATTTIKELTKGEMSGPEVQRAIAYAVDNGSDFIMHEHTGAIRRIGREEAKRYVEGSNCHDARHAEEYGRWNIYLVANATLPCLEFIGPPYYAVNDQIEISMAIAEREAKPKPKRL